jgi:hypothetical protein
MTDQAEQVSTTGLVDAKQHPGPTTHRQYSEALKRRIVAETPEPGHRCRSCLPDDPAALKRIIGAMAQDALTARVEISRLKFQLTTASSFTVAPQRECQPWGSRQGAGAGQISMTCSMA